MYKTNRIVLKAIALVLAATLLGACGGKEERKARYLERGKAYFEEQNFDKARVEFRNVLQIDPKTAEAYLYLAEFLSLRPGQLFGARPIKSGVKPCHNRLSEFLQRLQLVFQPG